MRRGLLSIGAVISVLALCCLSELLLATIVNCKVPGTEPTIKAPDQDIPSQPEVPTLNPNSAFAREAVAKGFGRFIVDENGKTRFEWRDDKE
jgi:hypothetical protein